MAFAPLKCCWACAEIEKSASTTVSTLSRIPGLKIESWGTRAIELARTGDQPVTKVAADLGISLISASFARDEVATGRVKLVELEGAELWRELGLAYRRDRTLSVATKTFVTVVRQLSEYLKKTEAPAHK